MRGCSARRARRGDIRIVPGEEAVVHATGERLDRIDLAGGEQLGADLFIDAGGALIAALDPDGAAPRAGFCDRVIRGSSPAFDPLPLYSRIAAHPAGWLTMIPLSDRTAIEFAYDSRRLSDADAPTALAMAARQSRRCGFARAARRRRTAAPMGRQRRRGRAGSRRGARARRRRIAAAPARDCAARPALADRPRRDARGRYL